MMIAMILCFGVVSALLLSGRGSFLIAGYNTASKKEKSRYNEKKLCRVMGAGMGVITLLLAVLELGGEEPPGWLIGVVMAAMLLDILAMIILSNTICKARPKDGEELCPETDKEKKRNSLVMKGSAAFTLLVFGVVGVLMFTGDVEVSIKGQKVAIEVSYWADYEIPLEDIKSVSYRDSVPGGARTNGLGSARLVAGHFKNEEFGSYRQYAYVKCKARIVLETTEGIVTLNAQTPEETKALGEKLKSMVPKE